MRHHPDPGTPGRDPEDSPSTTAGEHDSAVKPHRNRRGGAAHEEREGERGLRGLIGSGASQVGITAALRARDAARPTEADLAEAEARTVIVRRNWMPREELPRPGH